MNDDDIDGITPLSPEDESAVHDLLAALPDPPLPPDVEQRITAALGTGPGDTVPARPADTSATSTVLAASPKPPSGSWRHPRVLQAAAVLVILALVGAVTAGIVTQDSASSGGSVTASNESVGPITTSGESYSPSTLPTQVLGLLNGGSEENPVGCGLVIAFQIGRPGRKPGDILLIVSRGGKNTAEPLCARIPQQRRGVRGAKRFALPALLIGQAREELPSLLNEDAERRAKGREETDALFGRERVQRQHCLLLERLLLLPI